MPKPTGDIVQTQTNLRFFYQPGGACPSKAVKYGGQDGQFMNIESATNPVRSIEGIYVQDPKSAGRFRRVGRNRSAPDLPTATIQFLQRRGFVPEQLLSMASEPVTYYQVAGDTVDLSDFLHGWDSYVKIYAWGEVTDKDEGGGAWDSGEALQDDLDKTFERIYVVGPIGFSETASSELYSEGVDVVYSALGNGREAVYVLVDNVVASPGAGPAVVYRTEKDGDWANVAIDGAVATDRPQALAIVGKYLLAVFDDGDEGGYFYAELNQVTGVPGTWTKVQTGFVSGAAPQDIYAPNSRMVFLCGKGGYIYKTQAFTSGVSVLDAGVATTQQLNRIHGNEEVMVAVGEGAAIVVSEDRGNSWQASTAAPATAENLESLAVKSKSEWWIGDDAGNVFYTEKEGHVWVDRGLPSDLALVSDIVFATDEVGYILASTSAPVARIYATWNGGVDWITTDPRILNTPTADRFNRLAVPEVHDAAVASNWLTIAGLAGNGADGIVLIGEPKTT